METIIQNIRISYMAAAVPANTIELSKLSNSFGHDEVAKIIKATGIKQIRCADKNTCASDLCYHAAQHIFKNTNINKDEIDGLIFISQTPDYILPATSIILQDKFKLSQNTVCFDLPFGCSGYIYGCYLASMLILSGSCKKVLVLAGDTSTKMISKRDRSVRMVLGDAGTATIIEEGDNKLGVIMKTDGSGASYLIIPAGSNRKPSTDKTRTSVERENNDYRSDEDLFMDGLKIFKFALREVPPIIHETMDLMKWRKSEIGVYAFHQINEFVINYLKKIMNLNNDSVPVAVSQYGNTGPSSIPLMLCSTASKLNKNRLDKTIMCGFGVGLSWGTIASDLSTTTFIDPINI